MSYRINNVTKLYIITSQRCMTVHDELQTNYGYACMHGGGTKVKIEPVHEISHNVVCAASKASDQPARTRSLIRAFASRLSIL